MRNRTGPDWNTAPPRSPEHQDRRTYVWGNRRDTATLRNGHRHLVDIKRWGRH